MAEFAANLRHLAIRCNYGDFLLQALRDKFICGVLNNAIQVWLLTAERILIMGAVFTSHFPQKTISPSAITLKTYTRESMKSLGEVEVSVQYKR